ncbi:MAG: Zn-ribbon domain-containing OB-fold protein [Chloroflexi bacterium]|nr:Zn-ribbon domain-containing OB-fold protein [Chloroflexota bacterium]
MPNAKPKPSLDADIAPFWEAAKKHEFVLMRCKKCGAWYFPAAYCRFHDNEPLFGNMEWAKASGRGKVFSYNVSYRAFNPAFAGDLPYVYALIELEEGPLISSNVTGCPVETVKVGMPVELVWEDNPDGYPLPKFRPD